MHRYHCLFTDHGDHVFSGSFFTAGSDADAINHAVLIYGNGIGKGFELWRDDCIRVHTYIHPPSGLLWHPTGEGEPRGENPLPS
jgi:hypothetical protein